MRNARRRLVLCSHAPPLEGMEGGTAPSRGAATSFKKGQLLPAVRRTDRGLPPSENTRTPALAVGKKAARLGCNPPPLPQARRRLAWGVPRQQTRTRGGPRHRRGVKPPPQSANCPVRSRTPSRGRGGSLPRNEPQERTTLPRRQAHRHVCFSLTPACSHPAGHGLFEKNPC